MHNTNRIRLFAILLALALALAALPLTITMAAGTVDLYKDGDTTDPIVDSNEGQYLQPAAGHVGDTIAVYVPIINNTGSDISSVKCSLAVSDDVTKFPFENPDETKTSVEWTAYQKVSGGALVAWSGDSLGSGEHAYFKLEATFATGASQGYYQVPFTITYNGGTTSTVNVNVYCRGIDTTGGSSSGGGAGYKSKPKVIIESYEFSQDPIYAGDTVQLRLIIANTSTREAVTNVQLDYANEAGAVLPAPGGSSSVFLGTIDKNGVRALTIELQITPDAEAKSQVLAITLSYEGTKNRADFEEKASVSVPVQQKARVRVNDPVVYDEAWVGSSVSVGVTLYNLGKSTLYNCMVDVVGDELTLEETYFGGNIAAGGTMRADLSVIPTVGGELDAKVRVTYEDVNGNPTEQLLPLKMTVNEDMPSDMASPGDAIKAPGDQPAGAHIGWIFWTLGGLAAATGLVFLGIRLKKKRERALEDL